MSFKNVDYGRIAYQKVEDLEARLSKSKKSVAENTILISKSISFVAKDASILLARFKSEGENGSMVVKISLKNNYGQNNFRLYINSKMIANKSVGESGERELLFLCPMQLGKGSINSVVFSCENPCDLGESEVMITGTGISDVESQRKRYNAEFGVSKALFYSFDNGLLRALLVDKGESGVNVDTTTAPILLRAKSLAIGHIGGDRFVAACEDFFGNYFEVELFKAYEPKYYEAKMQFERILSFKNGIRLLFYRRDGALYYREMYGEGCLGQENAFLAGTVVLDVGKVDSSEGASVVVDQKDLSYIKESEPCILKGERLKFKIELTLVGR